MDSTATQPAFQPKQTSNPLELVVQTPVNLLGNQVDQNQNLQAEQKKANEFKSSVLQTPLVSGKSRTNNYALTATNTHKIAGKQVIDKFQSFYLDKGQDKKLRVFNVSVLTPTNKKEKMLLDSSRSNCHSGGNKKLVQNFHSVPEQEVVRGDLENLTSCQQSKESLVAITPLDHQNLNNITEIDQYFDDEQPQKPTKVMTKMKFASTFVNEKSTVSGECLLAASTMRHGQITKLPHPVLQKKRGENHSLESKKNLIVLQAQRRKAPLFDQHRLSSYIKLENQDARQQKKMIIQQQTSASPRCYKSGKVSPSESAKKKQKHNVRISADYIQTGETYSAKRNRFAQDAIKGQAGENEFNPNQSKTSLLQDRSNKVLNSPIRKKSSLVSITSNKFTSINHDNGVSHPVTAMISGGNSLDFDKGFMAKLGPILKVYDPGYTGAQNKTFTQKKHSKKQTDVKIDPSYNLQLKRTFKPIQISSRQQMTQFKSQLTNKVTNIKHPKNTIVANAETEELQFSVRFPNPSSKASGPLENDSGVKLPELGERVRQVQGSSAMAIIQNQKNGLQQRKNNSLSNRKSQLRSSQVSNSGFEDQYQQKLFMQGGTSNNKSMASAKHSTQLNPHRNDQHRAGSTVMQQQESLEESVTAIQSVLTSKEPSIGGRDQFPSPAQNPDKGLDPKTINQMNQRSTDSLHEEVFNFGGDVDSFQATAGQVLHGQKASSRALGGTQIDSNAINSNSNDQLVNDQDQELNLVTWSQKAILDAKQKKKTMKHNTVDDRSLLVKKRLQQQLHDADILARKVAQAEDSIQSSIEEKRINSNQTKGSIRGRLEDRRESHESVSKQQILVEESQYLNSIEGDKVNEQSNHSTNRKYNPVSVYNAKLPAMEKRAHIMPVSLQSRPRVLNPIRAASRVKEQPVRRQDISPHYTISRNNQVPRQTSFEELNEFLKRKKASQEWLRDYSLEKKESRQKLLQQSKKKGKEQNQNEISIQIQDQNTRIANVIESPQRVVKTKNNDISHLGYNQSIMKQRQYLGEISTTQEGMTSPPIIADSIPERVILSPSKLGHEKKTKNDRQNKPQKTVVQKLKANPQSSFRVKNPEESIVQSKAAQEWLTQTNIDMILDKAQINEQNGSGMVTKRQQIASRSHLTKNGPTPSSQARHPSKRRALESTVEMAKGKQDSQRQGVLSAISNSNRKKHDHTLASLKRNQSQSKALVRQEEPHAQSTKTLSIKSPSKDNVTKLESKTNVLGKVTKNADGPAKQFSLEDFDFLKDLGRGSFGQVKLIRHKKTHHLYALKILQKEMIRGSKHIQHIKNERNILKKLSKHGEPKEKRTKVQDSFFVGFIESFQDAENLYLLLEYLPGGELLKQIRAHLSLSIDQARFYLAEVLIAIEMLHENNIIYRDLKPENILLDQQGHIKLIDFGFSKQLKNLIKDRTTTNCGTPAYAAPEVILGTGYGYKADIWSFGILICEMIGGFTPFSQKGLSAMESREEYPSPGGRMPPPNQIIELANSGKLNLPKNMDAVTRDIVKRILVPDPNIRIDIKAIKQHKFFVGVDWDSVTRKRTEPPYYPRLDDDLNAPPITKQDKQEPVDKQISESNKLQMINEKLHRKQISWT